MIKVPIDVHWDSHNFCYDGKCPYCGKHTKFQKYGETNVRYSLCDKCGNTLNVRKWMTIK